MKVALDPDGWMARIFLCFAATAGIVYVNIMPALVDALQAGLGFSVQESGRIGSANTYGGALGAFTMAFIAPRLHWRRTLVVLSVALMAFDAGCLPLRSASMMMLMRFMHGLVGGAMVGMAYLIIARNQNPSRTFGILMVLQYTLYMVAIAVMPTLVRRAGIAPLFWLLVGFSALTLVFVLLLPEYPPRTTEKALPDARMRGLRLCALAAVLLFQAGNMSVNAFSVSLGQAGGLSLDYVSESLSASGFAGLLGGMVTMCIPTRWGLTRPLIASMALAAGSLAALFHVGDRAVWLMATMANGVAWALVLSLLLGVCASFDYSGQSAVWSGFMSKLGLATGPLLGSLMLNTSARYQALIVLGTTFVCLGLAAALPAVLVADRRASPPSTERAAAGVAVS
ncbi:MAG TPA: MFS transporter [Steroidobacteraceae bacterium]|nr:MFS transporter [Steroidobacteraceae bacterium]